MTTILSHQEDLGTIMLDVKYEGLGGTCLVTIPLNMAPNLSECNVSHGGIALLLHIVTIILILIILLMKILLKRKSIHL